MLERKSKEWSLPKFLDDLVNGMQNMKDKGRNKTT